MDDMSPRAGVRNPPQIISRTEAKALGLKKFFTGKRCKYGHLSDRVVIDGHCSECNETVRKAWRLANSGKLKAYCAAWMAAHPGYSKAHSARIRAEDAVAGFYLYFLRHPISQIVFWVGSSSSRKRRTHHLNEARRGTGHNPHKNAIVSYILFALGMEPIFEKVLTGLPEEEALELENLMIDRIGTLELGTGSLCNRGQGKRVPKSIDVMFDYIRAY